VLKLLDIVQRKEEWQLSVFRQALIKTDQVGVAELIMENIQRQQQQQPRGENTL